MSIAPPSDVVLDVAQAADPQKVRAATARLVQLGAGAGRADFSAQLASAGASASARATSVLPAFGGSAGVQTSKGSPYEKFEATMLRNFIETMLPKDSDLFGDETSADAYRSMMADQIATQIAKTGRLGIAHAIERAEADHQPDAGPSSRAAAPQGLHPPTVEPASVRTPA